MSTRRPGARRQAGNRWRTPLAVALALALGSATALTAANVVNPSKASDTTTALEVEPIRPSECAGITTTNTVTGTGIVAGTLGNDWLIGSEAIDTMDGLAGDDCIEGKGEADVIDGGLGNDVCIGGAGVDTFVGCETQIQ